MSFRYDDIGREFSQEELEKQNNVNNSIMEFIRTINPTTIDIYFNIKLVEKVRDLLIEIFTNDLKICTERKFYP
ncbi:hypothetical protein [Treponema sp. R80B11-R83G3]